MPDSSRPSFVPLTPEQEHYLRADVNLLMSEVRQVRRLFINDDGSANCMLPGAKCAALDMAETAHIGIAELHGVRRRDTRNGAMITAAVMACAAVIGVVGWALISRQASAAVSEQVPVAVEFEIAKRLPSIQATSFAAARDGAKFALTEFQKSLPNPPIRANP